MIELRARERIGSRVAVAPADGDGRCYRDKDMITDGRRELVEVASGKLDIGVGSVVEMDLHSHLEAELSDAFDDTGSCAVRRCSGDDEIVRAYPVTVVQRRWSEEGRHELIGWVVVASGRRPHLLEIAVSDDRNLVSDLHRLFLIVGDEHGGDLHLFDEISQPTAKLFSNLGIKGTERLVEEEHTGCDGKGSGKSHPLTLAPGEL